MATGIRKLSKFCTELAELYSAACGINFSICIVDVRADNWYSGPCGGRLVKWNLAFWIDDEPVASSQLFEDDPAEIMQQILSDSHHYIMKDIMEKEEISWQKKT